MSSFKNQVHAVGGLAFLIVGGFFFAEITKSRDAGPCTSRYPSATQMSLARSNGVAMTPAEFEARVGSNEQGVIEKTAIKRGSGPHPLTLDVTIGGAPGSAPGTGNGAYFFWTPAHFAPAATTACLAYDVLMPAGFELGDGGLLPGLYGGAAGKAEEPAGFTSRIGWSNTGGLNAVIDHNGSSLKAMAELGDVQPTRAKLPLGRWFSVEQEVVLNEPGAKDGILRVWIDGQLVLETGEHEWRATRIALAGVISNVSYLATDTNPHKPVTISFSPMRLAWN